MIIGLGNRKGGSGKTSTANALVTHLKYSDKYKDLKIIGVDVDSQMSWYKMRQRDLENLQSQYIELGEEENFELIKNNMFPLVYEPVSSIFDKVNFFAENFDIVVFDLPGTLDQAGVLEAYALMDKIIIPTSVTQHDIDSTEQFLEKIYTEVFPLRQKIGFEPIELIGVLSRIQTNAASYRSIEKDLQANGLKDLYGFEFVSKPFTYAQTTFGDLANTYDVLRNSSGHIVYEDLLNELVLKLGIK